jgi:hypothetical protein
VKRIRCFDPPPWYNYVEFIEVSGESLSQKVRATSANETADFTRLLLAIPALFSLVFCFGFILMHHDQSSRIAIVSTHPSPLLATPPTTLPTLQLQNESPLPIASVGSSADASFAGINTTSPQPGNGYGRSNLQPQTSNGQAANNSGDILSNIGSSLNGVLNSAKN